MNRNCYRLVRNRLTQLWIPAPEHARGRGKGAARAALLLSSSLLSMVAHGAGALPVPCGAGACGTNPSVPGFASHGAAAYAAAGNRAFVSQVGNKAILNWQNFNVGRGNAVTFQQVQDLANGNLVAGANFSTLNRIWQADPSVIAGAINVAPGQKGNLTFINQNGIVFAGTAQVDVNTLTATSLNMADKFFTGALTPFGNAEAQFEGTGGFVSVLEGARISAANGGRVMLLAPTVINRGRIEVPDGQAILAAGSKVYLSASQDANLRGFLVEVDSPAGLASFNAPNAGVPVSVALDGETHAVADAYSNLGNVTNTGNVQVGTGNATMVGYAVNQMGRVSATNSVVFSGSVYLTAKDTKKNLTDGSSPTVIGFASTRAGQVRVGENSRTAVMPALDAGKVQAALSGGTLTQAALDAYLAGDAGALNLVQYAADTTSLDSQTFNRAQVRVVGQDVRVESGAQIRAPAGEVAIYAVEDPSRLKIYDPAINDVFASPSAGGISQARVQFAPSARIDVSGLEAIPVSVARNMVEVRLQGDELKDSPVNRDGVLRGQTVWLDVTRGSALVSNIDDYKTQIGRDIAERSTDAGTISLRSQGELVVAEGVTLDVSGGYVDFTAAATKRTVLATNGRLVDIANASPDVRYDGVASRIELTDPRWGTTRIFDAGENHFNPGYREGKDAGTVELLARQVVFDGSVIGRTSPGQYQTGDQPDGAALRIGASLPSGSTRDHFLAQQVAIGGASGLPPGFLFGDMLPDALRDKLTLPSRLFGGDGVNRLELYSNKAVSIDQPVRVAPGGSVKVTGESVNVQAPVEAQGGSISLSARDNLTTPTLDGLDLTIGNGVTLDVSGRWINDAPGGVTSAELRAIDGGSITLGAGNNVVLGTGSRFNLTGGVYRDVAGKTVAGDGGDLALSFLQLRAEQPGTLQPLQQHIDAAGPGQGGALTLSAQRVEVGAFDAGTAGVVRLDPQFFRQGFASYSVTGLEGVDVLPGTQVQVRTASRELLPAAAVAATGTDIRTISSVQERPDELRDAASLALKAGVYLGQASTLELAVGSRLEVDPGSTVNLAASGRMNIFGAVHAPAGAITATLEKDINALPYETADALVLGAGSLLSTAGVARVFPDARGLRKGDVLAAGTITLNAVTGYLMADANATLDVSGAAPVQLDQPNAQGGFGMMVAGDAGRVSVAAREGLVFDATVRAQGGGSYSRGGTFDLLFGSKAESTVFAYPSLERVLDLGGASPGIPADFNTLSGRAHVDPVRLEQSGFDTISLSSLDTIRFQSDVRLGTGRVVPLGEIRLDAPQIDVNGHQVALAASIIAMGNYDVDRQSSAPPAVTGAGRLAADAGFLELAGNTTWNGAAALQFGSETELRLTGVRGTTGRPTGRIDTTANVSLSAGVVAPSTLTDFVLHTSGDVDVSGRAATPAPLSALGAVSIEATNITQGGTIHAPYGTVALEAVDNLTLLDGSVTSVGGNPGITPFGMTVNGRSWVYDYGSANQTIAALDEKTVSLKGQSVNMLAGSRVDVAGRGDLQAWEFTPGPGGSTDVLSGPGVYAVLPGYRGVAIPGDPQNAADFDRAAGTAVWLDNAPGLPAGVYTLLPAHYALLPGAYMIQLAGAGKDVLPGRSGAQVDGSLLVSGYLTDSRHAVGGPRDGRYSGYTLLPQAEVLRRSEFTLTSATTFFGGENSGRPGDAGSLVIDATQALTLKSAFDTTSVPGLRGAQVDITAPKIAVVAAGGAAPGGTGFLEIDVQSLNNLNASSLLIGGTRTKTAEGLEVRVGAQEVVIANTDAAPLTGQELLFAANDKLTVKAGSVVESTGAAGVGAPPKLIAGFRIADTNGNGTITAADDNRGDINGDGQINASDNISGNGALLRVAAGAQAAFERRSVDRSTGEITIEGAQLPGAGGRPAAVLRADGSLRVDATKQTLIDGNLQLATGGALAIGATRVSVGETGGVTEGLVLSNERLAALGKPADFAIRSYSTFDLYGNAVLGDPAGGPDRIRTLSIEAGGIGGHANTGKTALIAADTVTLANPDGTAFAGAPVPGDGELQISAQTVRLGSGGVETAPFEIRGFSTTTLAAGREVVAQGTSELKSDKALTVETTRITTAAGANARVSVVDGALVTAAPAVQATGLGAAGLGGKLVLSAPTITHGTRIDMPSGVVQLNATGAAGPDGAGSVTLAPDSSVSVAGTAVRFFDVTRFTTGGTVTLSSANANVLINADAVVDVSGADGADAGTLAILATKGTAQLDGTLLGAAHATGDTAPRQGNFVLDVATLSNFNKLNQILESTLVGDRIVSGGFAESRDIRVRNGNVEIGSAGDPTTTVTARKFQLAADAGRIDVYGQIDARGDSGGTVKLYAGTGLTVHTDAGIAASAAAAGSRGGDVLLSTSAGNVSVAAGSNIDVSAGADGRAGELHLRAPRSAGNNEINIASLAGTVTGAGVIRAEGFKTYVDTSIATADFGTGASPATSWFNEAKNFMDDTAAIETRLGMVSDNRFQLAPGIEIRSTSTATSVVDQTLANDWTLHTWRFDPDSGSPVTDAGQLASGLNAAGKPLVAGVLTIRSTGALNLNGSLSDGFNSFATTGAVQGRDSWSYRLVAGADLTAANPLAVNAGSSDVTLASAKLVRTGTGDIDIASSDGIRLNNFQSVIYAAGRTVDAAELAGFTILPPAPTGTGATASDYNFTRDGGDINLAALGDIELVTTPTNAQRQLYSNWLYRQGRVDSSGNFNPGAANPDPQTAWWVRFDKFQQGIGALGGGNVNATAGGSVKNVSMSSATQGFMASARPDPESLTILGDGDISVKAGGDILGGQYWSGRGDVALQADGSLSSWNTGTVSAPRALYPIVALGEGQADVRARGNVELLGIIDPLLVVQDVGVGRNVLNPNQTSPGFSRWTLFSSQGEDTSAALTSLNGTVRIHNPQATTNSSTAAVGVSAAFGGFNWNASSVLYSASSDRPLSLAPASLQATAYQGDIDILNNMILRPAANGALDLYAGRNVSISGTLVMSDMDVARVPVASGLPIRDTGDLPAAVNNWRSHAEAAPVHLNDENPVRIYAAGGAVAGKANTVSLILPKAVRIQAATDIKDLGLEGQNLRDSDVTSLRAGNDIGFTNLGIRAKNAKVQIGGPGLVDIEARNLDLGASEGVVTRGNLDNPALPEIGAAINVAVGVPNGVDYQGAMDRIVAALQAAISAGAALDDATLWQTRWLTGDSSIRDAATALVAVQNIDSLPDAAQRLRVRSMFYQALRDTGRDYNNAASPYAGDYTRGYKTIELLFPGIDERDALGRSLRYNGELNLFASRVRTERGGDIEFMVPGGQAVIGLAQLPDALAFYDPATGDPGSTNQNPVALGMVTVERGAIRGFTREDVLVNQSRILTVGGGDIVLWSSEADIDAGKGKRTVTTVPPPIIKIDSSGNISVELQGVATGSGIGALAGQPGVVAGDVDLIAPKGAVNAGEAGIRASNLNIAALVVLNAANIQVSGTTAGAPVADTSGLASGLAGNSVSDTQGQDAARALSNQSAEAQKTADDVRRALAAFSLISVEVLGFGDQ